MKNEIRHLLTELCGSAWCGGVGNTPALIAAYLSEYAVTERLPDGGVLGTLKGSSDYTVMLEAHYDQIGFVVTEIADGGFVKLGAVGGIDARMLPSTRIRILGKSEVKAVFCSVPPHLAAKGNAAPELGDLYADTGIGSGLENTVSIGDPAVFDARPVMLSEDCICSPSLDDRAGCAALLVAAKALSSKGKLPVTVKFLFADKEELGMRGSVTGAYTVMPDEAIAVDVSFADTPGIQPYLTGNAGAGAMIGISPSLTKSVSDLLTESGRDGAAFQYEVMGGRTGTDADVMGTVKGGCRTGLVSIPERNMHTCGETVRISDVCSVAEILVNYIMKKEA